MARRPFARPLARPLSGRGAAGGASAAGGGGPAPVWAQQVIDPGFASAGQHVLSGSGIGTSAVAAGVLTIASTTNVYFERPLVLTTPLPQGTYSVTFTISAFATGAISPITASDTAFSANVVLGTSRGANATYTETIVLLVPGYIGLSGRGASIVNSMVIDDLTIQQVS